MSEHVNKVHDVAVVLYENADILDFAAPIEVLSHVFYGNNRSKPAFKLHVIAATQSVRTGSNLTIGADLTFEQAMQRLETFDICVVPGSSLTYIAAMVKKQGPEIQFIQSFAQQNSAPSRQERVVLSICTGSVLVAATGALTGLRATSHHTALDMLRDVDPSIEVIDSEVKIGRKRYVDGGVNRAGRGPKMISAGGVSCGLDASLYVAELKAGPEAAQSVADLIEYVWKRA